jgi:putative aldouronate transport system permease protein
MKIKTSFGEKAFDLFNVLLLFVLCSIVMIPLLHVAASSLSSKNALIHSQVKLWPVEFNLDSYAVVFQNELFWRSFFISVTIVVLGTLLNMLLTLLTGYPLSKAWLRGRKLIMLYIVFTMIFQAPVIPTYLVVKSLGLINTIGALIIPLALSAFNLLLCITFFRSLPEELFEAAKVDGMSEFGIVWKIAVPLSMPINVTLLLFYAVGHWNNYFTAMLYITKLELRPLQVYLYSLVSQANINDALASANEISMNVMPQSIQMATIVVATLPILFIYPFVQKHFIKGATLGSVKE